MGQTTTYKLPWFKMTRYSVGFGGGAIMSALMASFITSYYTDTVLLNAAAIGTMYLIARIFDGISDFVMGAIIDKTHTRLGKARPWMILSAPLMLIGMILVVSIPLGASDGAKLAFAYLTYIFLNCIVYTIYAISYNTLLAVCTRHAKERDIAATLSIIVNGICSAIVGGCMLNLVNTFGWAGACGILGFVAAIMILIPSLTIKEEVTEELEEANSEALKMPIKQQIAYALKNKYWFLCLLSGALLLIVNANAMNSIVYYCNIVMGEKDFAGTLLGFCQIPALITLVIMPFALKKVDKRTFMVVGCLIQILGFVILAFAGNDHTMLMLGAILRFAGFNPILAGFTAMTASISDYNELKTGVRVEGVVATSYSIGSKIGIGVGSALTGWILGAFGYNPLAEAQAASVVNGVVMDFSWIGVIMSIILTILILMMDVEKKVVKLKAENAR